MDALLCVAQMLANGQGVAKDEAAAFFAMAAAAERGVVGAMLQLGDMLEHGRGCEKDEKAALTWYRSAFERAPRLARTELESLLARRPDLR